ncbi:MULTISPECIES: helix-turn-helix domain-containing protein [Acetobacter]|uniref:helix-turn-helix domain-containing protein n=1 Tax=Acetobacter TaxID=434 RepID=UPI00140B579C|nr:LysR family transcriptional regulator [Acetobacter lovaniensis]MCI1698590.1 LysR family transcriptional regulator [Acetobacter lovaniensis]MCI1795654.1 LysR family transcriptional regulator [Acetobacter lovaniensis]MCP1239896.1 LysR family transcriptional regulator [Acetobacter lovaniensis]NHN81998.1 LysR family transcriptional regulator [Acetobacter lovaniensis]
MFGYFCKVVESGSFVRVAEDVQLSKPTVSTAVRRLEHFSWRCATGTPATLPDTNSRPCMAKPPAWGGKPEGQ